MEERRDFFQRTFTSMFRPQKMQPIMVVTDYLQLKYLGNILLLLPRMNSSFLNMDVFVATQNLFQSFHYFPRYKVLQKFIRKFASFPNISFAIPMLNNPSERNRDCQELSQPCINLFNRVHCCLFFFPSLSTIVTKTDSINSEISIYK